MFVRRKEYAEVVECLFGELNSLRTRYWDLWRAHKRLLDHLGLVEVEVREHTELRPRTGKEELR